jgi:biopolymer transport protein ExbD
MKRKHYRHISKEEAELDITAFMNLMIVLVPILLLGLVFSKITVVDVTLPAGFSGDDADNKHIELVIRAESLSLAYPRGILLKTIPMVEDSGEYDFFMLSLVLQEVKRQLREKGIEKQSITILSEQDIEYQTIVTAMDTVRSFKAVVAASVVDAALFPDISFGDAPILPQDGELL